MTRIGKMKSISEIADENSMVIKLTRQLTVTDISHAAAYSTSLKCVDRVFPNLIHKIDRLISR